jgi:hypothetical protein
MTRKRVPENPAVVSSAAAAPARRKSVSTKRVSRPTVVELASSPVSEPEVLSVAAVAAASETPAESYQDAVARLAYSYWAARGYQGGSPEADWLRAEQELLVK